ncbi:inositol-pentakisphosphate 2-kinase [Geopyxis carbonaria]|nr:inositol-pentakisphosphate 2-kinase [Geopyxis carbonaria]
MADDTDFRPPSPGSPPPPGFTLSDPSEWSYFTEGANNILFRYTGTHPYFTPFLLRLRKHLPGAPSTLQLHAHLRTHFAPRLGAYMMRTDLIDLAPGFTAALNRALRTEPRGPRRLLDEAEPRALLVEDMSCGHYLLSDTPPAADAWRDLATVEFKPRWLAQSANAPPGWRLCRTCAVRLMNGARGEDEEAGTYCPLDLASGDTARIEAAVYALVNEPDAVMIADPAGAGDEEEEEEEGEGEGEVQDAVAHELATALEAGLVTLLTHHFRHSDIIPLLAELQAASGARGVFTSATLALLGDGDALPDEAALAEAALAAGEHADGGNDIWTAMTLRDCSLFLKVWVRRREGRGMEAKIECKVGDLDLKTGEGGRAVYWRDVERRLRKGGWYFNTATGRNCRTGEGTL